MSNRHLNKKKKKQRNFVVPPRGNLVQKGCIDVFCINMQFCITYFTFVSAILFLAWLVVVVVLPLTTSILLVHFSVCAGLHMQKLAYKSKLIITLTENIVCNQIQSRVTKITLGFF